MGLLPQLDFGGGILAELAQLFLRNKGGFFLILLWFPVNSSSEASVTVLFYSRDMTCREGSSFCDRSGFSDMLRKCTTGKGLIQVEDV